ncbi:MAG: amino acid ABC transporter permease [Candidatus Dactylopiibacterium carminicum]|uniref:Amino acid ABC transporter permease n=1 Tax=Candidatus Dactylopiibacterium carminicum TaxID=857335 RepID=A0A272EVR5_9RHOO|nr:amino acid ABC transporter permease [Candidatus Dactylopiibacterium carminicum]PAS94197.1 MAG: amino acid ABC transporter permease [Candidatus Dactylopiibacterium carminicum]PAS96792.1 MAG: amino acid ABC transporter permease [Candidatus Dactylopiibacterium carminicum]
MISTFLADGFLAPKYLGWLLDGWLMTLWASLLVVLASTLLGMAFAAARESGRAPLAHAAGVYVALFRNTPLLVQLFFWYFGVPALLPEGVLAWLNGTHALAVGSTELLRWPSFEFLSAIVGLVAYSTAYVGEDIRSGLRGVPASQRIAATALGFTPLQALRYVVLPQALRIAMPPLLGQYMNILKNTSLGMAIGLMELSYRARQAEAETWKTFQVYGVATLLYIVAIAALEVLAHGLQRRNARRSR